MATNDVILLEIGQPKWRRWMVFHNKKRRYWSTGLWKKRKRDGEVWHDKAKAEQELRMVRLGS